MDNPYTQYAMIIGIDLILSLMIVLTSFTYVALWFMTRQSIKIVRPSWQQVAWLVVLIGAGIFAGISAYLSYALLSTGVSFSTEMWLLLRTGMLITVQSMSLLVLSVPVKEYVDATRTMRFLWEVDQALLEERTLKSEGGK